HAMYQLMVEDCISITTISVQLPEDLNAMLSSATGLSKKVVQNSIDYLNSINRPLNLAELAKERIRLVCNKFKIENSEAGVDLGCKVFKLDKSCFSNWNSKKISSEQELLRQLELHVANVAEETNGLDTLYEIL